MAVRRLILSVLLILWVAIKKGVSSWGQLRMALKRTPSAGAIEDAARTTGTWAAEAPEVADEMDATEPGAASQPSSTVYQHAVFKSGDRVRYADSENGTIVGMDDDGDLNVLTDDGRTALWYIAKCTKRISQGDRVVYRGGEIAIVTGFDSDDDLLVEKENGKCACWFREKTARLLSAGDAVQYVCGDMGTVVDVDADGDVVVHTADDRTATWFAHKCNVTGGA